MFPFLPRYIPVPSTKTGDHSSGQVIHLVVWVGGICAVSDDEMFFLQCFKHFFELS